MKVIISNRPKGLLICGCLLALIPFYYDTMAFQNLKGDKISLSVNNCHYLQMILCMMSRKRQLKSYFSKQNTPNRMELLDSISQRIFNIIQTSLCKNSSYTF